MRGRNCGIEMKVEGSLGLGDRRSGVEMNRCRHCQYSRPRGMSVSIFMVEKGNT